MDDLLDERKSTKLFKQSTRCRVSVVALSLVGATGILLIIIATALLYGTDPTRSDISFTEGTVVVIGLTILFFNAIKAWLYICTGTYLFYIIGGVLFLWCLCGCGFILSIICCRDHIKDEDMRGDFSLRSKLSKWSTSFDSNHTETESEVSREELERSKPLGHYSHDSDDD